MIKNGGTVLGAFIIALAVKRGRVVAGKKSLKHIRVSDLPRIKDDLAHFGMAGCSGANLFVGWIIHGAAAVPGCNGVNAF